MAIIEFSNLAKKYPKPSDNSEFFFAVDHISLTIEPGEIFGILGPNGAGKTTTLEMLEGLVDIDEGTALVNGIDVETDPYALKQDIGVQLQANEYFDKLCLQELLDLFCGLYRRQQDANAILAKVDLNDKARALPSQLSGGQKQRFSIACALANDPKVLFLDEPTTGLDPTAKRKLWELVKSLNASGKTIVLTTHNMEEAEYLCHRVAIMNRGKIVACDKPLELIQQYAPTPPTRPVQGNLEDVFLSLTGFELSA